MRSREGVIECVICGFRDVAKAAAEAKAPKPANEAVASGPGPQAMYAAGVVEVKNALRAAMEGAATDLAAARSVDARRELVALIRECAEAISAVETSNR
jgi:hypothetical protein